MDREVRQHLLRPQMGSRKRKSDFMFPESRRKIGRLDMMANYINPMTGLVHRHTPYKLNMALGSEQSALGRLKDVMMLENPLRPQRKSEGRKQRPLTRIPDLTRLNAPPGVGNLLGLQMSALRKHLQQKVGKDSKVSTSKSLDNKRQKLLRDKTGNPRAISIKRPRPLKFDAMSLSGYPLSPHNYLDMGNYLMFSDNITPPRGGVTPGRISDPLSAFVNYVHPLSIAFNNQMFKTSLKPRGVPVGPSAFNK